MKLLFLIGLTVFPFTLFAQSSPGGAAPVEISCFLHCDGGKIRFGCGSQLIVYGDDIACATVDKDKPADTPSTKDHPADKTVSDPDLFLHRGDKFSLTVDLGSSDVTDLKLKAKSNCSDHEFDSSENSYDKKKYTVNFVIPKEADKCDYTIGEYEYGTRTSESISSSDLSPSYTIRVQ